MCCPGYRAGRAAARAALALAGLEVLTAVDQALPPGHLLQAIAMVERSENDRAFQAAVAALSPDEAAPMLGALTLLEQWHATWRGATRGPLLRRLLAAEQSALAECAGRGH